MSKSPLREYVGMLESFYGVVPENCGLVIFDFADDYGGTSSQVLWYENHPQRLSDELLTMIEELYGTPDKPAECCDGWIESFTNHVERFGGHPNVYVAQIGATTPTGEPNPIQRIWWVDLDVFGKLRLIDLG